MTDDELIEGVEDLAQFNAEAKVIEIFPDALSRLIALARIGAAVQPRPGKQTSGKAIMFLAAVTNQSHSSNNRAADVILDGPNATGREVVAHIPLSALPKVKP